jgi:hypothetical protein
MRADDETRQHVSVPTRPGLGEGLDYAGVITAQVREDVPDTRFRESLEERGACRIGTHTHILDPRPAP